MALIDHIDGPARLVYMDVSTINTDIHPIDIYKEMRTMRANDENLRKYNLFMSASGNIPKTATTSTERYVTLLGGTRIVPYDSSHVITVTGTIITDSGESGVDCFDKSVLTPGVAVDINYVPPQVEIITIVQGSAVTEQDKLDIADRVHDEAAADHTIPDSFGKLMQDVKEQTDTIGVLVDESGGKWEIVGNQMIFYKEDNITEIMRFNLFDSSGNPSMTEVYSRERVS